MEKLQFRTLEANEIDCRVSQIASNWLTLLLYKDARVDMNVLDETVGAMNWKKSYVRDNANCIVSIYDEIKKEWVSKEDTGTESFTEQEKGLASDSFKRACFNWGIGRELYTAPSIFITPRKDMGGTTKDDEECKEFFENGTDSNGKKKYATKTKFWVEYIDYDDKRNIQNLIIRDNKNNMRFAKLTKEKEKEFFEEEQKLKKLLDEKEEKNSKFNREDLFKYYNAPNGNLLLEQRKDAIKQLSKGDKKNE